MDTLTTQPLKRIKAEDVPLFDIAKYLDSEERIAGYLDDVLQDEDMNMDVLIAALGHIARARGMAQIASQTGISREALYRSLKANKKPRFETISKVCAALGLRLTVQSTLKSTLQTKPA